MLHALKPEKVYGPALKIQARIKGREKTYIFIFPPAEQKAYEAFVGEVRYRASWAANSRTQGKPQNVENSRTVQDTIRRAKRYTVKTLWGGAEGHWEKHSHGVLQTQPG